MVMLKVNVFEVKARLSEYLDRAIRGERIVICRHNRPVAELRPVEQIRTEPRPIGPLPGRPAFDLPRSFFDALSNEELDRWEGLGADPLSSADVPPFGPRTSKMAERKTRARSRARRRGSGRRS
jgi:prevent-host-death family protein